MQNDALFDKMFDWLQAQQVSSFSDILAVAMAPF